MTFDEFRVVVQPELSPAGGWEVSVQKAPRAMFVGRRGVINPVVKAADLARLRNATAVPDVNALKQLGQDVVRSIMTDQVQDALAVVLDDAQKADKGLRIVVAIVGSSPKPDNGVSCHEIPVEAVFTPALDFLATNTRTPVSRGLSVEADQPAVKVVWPLRILVVVSEPSNMPPVQGDVEMQGLTRALKPLVDSGSVKLSFCTPPTADRLATMLQQERFHIVHFIGHGDFDLDGIDPSPQPYLYFEDGSPARERRAVDPGQMHTILRNGNVPLVVMTACASAASKPNDAKSYPALAFEGLAQSLVARQGGPVAAVAMQFDLETDAAEVFSRALYEQLLTEHARLDSAVASARSALAARFGTGHRSWVNPTVFWRCIDGTVFDFARTGGDLTEAQALEHGDIVASIRTIQELLTQLAAQPSDIVAATAPIRAQWLANIDALEARRGALLGDSVRLRGGTLAADGTVQCHLTIRLRLGARIGDVTVRLAPDVNEFEYVSATKGAAAVGEIFPKVEADGRVTVLVQNASGLAEWTPDEYVLATITFRAKNPAARPLFKVPVSEASVTRNQTVEATFARLDAVVFRA